MIGGVLLALVIFILVFISLITKYLIEKYDVKYTGREITINWLYVNPFTGYAHINDMKIYEQKSDSVFFQTDGLTIDFAMLKLFNKTYEISNIQLNQPKVNIIRFDSVFNFNDLIVRFTPDPRDSLKPPTHFNILDIEVKDAILTFKDTLIPVYYFVKNVNLKSSGKHWDIDSMEAKMSLKAGIGTGEMSTIFKYYFSTTAFQFMAELKKFDFNLFEQYMKEFMNYGSLKGNLDASLTGFGDMRDKENIDIKGKIALNDFHFGQQENDDLASFKKLSIDLERVAPKGRIYFIDSIRLEEIFLKYERYDYLDNFQRIFGKSGSNVVEVDNSGNFNLVIEIAKYIKEMVRHFFISYYRLNSLNIINGKIMYNDYAVNELFAVQLSALNIKVDSLDKFDKNINLHTSAAIKPYGNLNISLNMSPRSYEDFVLNYHIQQVPISLANPYLITYTSFPFNRGTIELKGAWNVKNGEIKSENHILLIDPRVADRVKNNKWIPMQFIMAIIRENGNVIDYNVPISGELKNPKFHLKDVIRDVIKNIFVKPVTTPYRFIVKNTENQLEKTLTCRWNTRSAQLTFVQETYLKKVANFLHKNPDVTLTVSPIEYEVKEKEAILFFNAKKKYLSEKMSWNTENLGRFDSLQIQRLWIKDSLFIVYLDKKCAGIFMYTIQEKCHCLVGEKMVASDYKSLQHERMIEFMSAFKDLGIQNQIKFSSIKNEIPYNGFSYFRMKFNKEIPEELMKAYEKIDMLDEQKPRKEYRKKRLKINMLPTKQNTPSKSAD